MKPLTAAYSKDPEAIEEEVPRCEMESTVALSTSTPNQIRGRVNRVAEGTENSNS
jgi:hypothetical protein